MKTRVTRWSIPLERREELGCLRIRRMRMAKLERLNGETRAFEGSSQRPNLYRALLKGGEIAVQVSDGFDAAEIIF